jgi:maltooligosyltrehalose trehalohydrolase
LIPGNEMSRCISPVTGAVRYLDEQPPGAVHSGDSGSTTFRVWAPLIPHLGLHLLGERERTVGLEAERGGYHQVVVNDAVPGTTYRFVLPDGKQTSDPASRSQPSGVGGPSEVFDAGDFSWNDAAFRPPASREYIIYEMHIGTFTAAGTLDAAAGALEHLVDLGVTAVELMPLAQFPGKRNWGYDAVFPFAVQNSYGGPRALQRFVDTAHRHGLAVVLDVVYNHLGPEGNILDLYGPYFTDRYRTPWGQAVNVDGPGSDDVRSYFVSNAIWWFDSFHVDALRLDAVHGIVDTSAKPFLLELSQATKALGSRLGRPLVLIAESADNNPLLVSEPDCGGSGIDSQWNDDFHHALHTVLTGESNGYYEDYGRKDELCTAISDGFVFQGEFSQFRRRRHGAPSGHLDPERFVVFVQNHDQVGNRPRGNRLSSMLDVDQLRLAAAVLFLSPYVPLLFMGEEYAETAPFPYFVDHSDERLLEMVRKGREAEMRNLGFAEEGLDPADPNTFELAHIDLDQRSRPDHAPVWAAYRGLLKLRRSLPALEPGTRDGCRADLTDAGLIAMKRSGRDPSSEVVVFCNLNDTARQATMPAGALTWRKIADGASPELGGSGVGSLPETLQPGDLLSVAAWGFCAYAA